MSKDKYIPCLLKVFRDYGYDGATLAKISQATGLGKASLYHHFPGGKDEMVTAVLNFLENCLAKKVLQALKSGEDPQTRFQKMCKALDEIYQGGEAPCLFAILLMGSARDMFHTKVQDLLFIWLEEMARVLIESGLDRQKALERSQDAAIAIQGSLVLAQGLNDPSIFKRVIEQLPEKLVKLT
jgi:AcrR family transcriptional regulator